MPRCELNYFLEERKRKYCNVCLAELNLGDTAILIPDEDSELEKLCPVCKINYMSPEEDMCFLCSKERATAEPEDVADDWQGYMDEEPPVQEEPIEISLSELEEQENEEEEEFEEEETFGDDFEELDESDIEFDDDDDDDFDDDDDDDF